MDALALKGDVPSLSAFYHKHAYADTTTNKKKAIIHAAMSSSHVPVLDWLVATATDQGWVNTIWTGKTWVTAAHAGHVAVLAWAHAKGLLNLDTFTMELRLAATAGHVPVLEWIHQQISVRCPYSAEEVRLFPRAANNGGRANILQWRWNRVASHSLPAPAESAALVDVAMLTGNMDTVRWWWATFERHRTPDHRFGTAETTLRAVSSGSLSLVKWLWAVADANSSSEYFTDWSPRCPFDLPTGKCASSLLVLK
ncbi:hypothetical protein BC828DRAFT_127736 [Blastocladiella britannica]|nr:hypothetical protein BC828DRAFT_127736 [Blastocladiella britannica]